MPFRNRDEYFNSYTEDIGIATVKVNPIVTRGGTVWVIRIFTNDNQGPVDQLETLTVEKLEEALDADFEEMDIDRERIEEINKARRWADRFLWYDSTYNRKERGDATMDMLIYLSGRGQVEAWQNPLNLF